MITIELPWPDRRLSPNARVSWQAKMEPKKTAREIGYAETRNQHLVLPNWNADNNYQIRWIFHPPDRRKRDQGNCHDSMKYYQDGVCEALGIDDEQFKRTILEWGDVDRDGGHVVMEIQPLQ